MNTATISPAQTLTEESQAARKLIDLLKKEQAQLIAADIEGLPALTEEKAKIVSELSELSNRRYKALGAAGFQPQESGMPEWLNKSAAVSAAKIWEELKSLARTAKELNRVNGMLINKHMTRNQQALNVLKIGPQGQAFYGPDGQSTGKAASRGLAVG